MLKYSNVYLQHLRQEGNIKQNHDELKCKFAVNVKCETKINRKESLIKGNIRSLNKFTNKQEQGSLSMGGMQGLALE